MGFLALFYVFFSPVSMDFHDFDLGELSPKPDQKMDYFQGKHSPEQASF